MWHFTSANIRVDVQMILSEPKFFRFIDNQFFLPMVLRCFVTQCFTRQETRFFCNITKAFTRHRMNFRPTEKFERTLRSLGTVQYLHSVHKELWTARLPNFRTVKVFPFEEKEAPCLVSLRRFTSSLCQFTSVTYPRRTVGPRDPKCFGRAE